MPDLTTPQKIVDQANELAGKFHAELAKLRGYSDPAWRLACIAMCRLKNTDPNEAVRQLEKEKEKVSE